MSVTFSTCWYALKSKFDHKTYSRWIDNMLSNVNHYNLVVYTDTNGLAALSNYMDNPRIHIVWKPETEFYNYKYKSHWTTNHAKNSALNTRVDWNVNMLWSEKVHFVYETMQNEYFCSDYYGWVDIGYFRGTDRDLSKTELKEWCCPAVIEKLSPTKIYYALVNNDKDNLKKLSKQVRKKDADGLPTVPIPDNVNTIAGGFFITHKQNIEWWRSTYDEKLALYFQNNRLVKDDQTIVVDCVLTHPTRFNLCKEENPLYNNWFLFQRFLNATTTTANSII